MNLKAPEVSIIVRTYNEERWIGHCLGSIFNQDFDNFEVILVDNNSTDHTVKVAKRYPVSTIVKIDKFFPGKALNDGIRASTGNYIVCISAHCIPKDEQWLRNLYNNFDDNDKLAGVYGRQLPLSYTSDADKRDLLITFGRDKKVQVKDYFFHNANSMFPRSIWDELPFDEEATNIEDRIWGKQVIEAGYQIIYEPSAEVYHYHGLHQHGNSSDRAKGIATILDKLDEGSIGDLPQSLKPENANFVAVLPVLGGCKVVDDINFLQRTLDYLKTVKYINNIYVLTDNKIVSNLAIQNKVKVITRPDIIKDPNLPLEKVLQYALKCIEAAHVFPEAIVYINYLHPFRPAKLIDELILKLQYEGLDSVFSSYVDFGNYWKECVNGGYSQVGDALLPRVEKHPLHRALYGVGCVTLTPTIRTGNLVGNKVGIAPLNNLLYALRLDDETPIEIILSGIRHTEKIRENV
jgi:glycosyltransferase involved in cell wall biosynthesis